MSKSGIACYRNGGCGPYEMYSCSECPASKSDYLQHNLKPKSITNYDRITSKPPEELAKWISETIDCGVCEVMHGFRMCDAAPCETCEDCWAGWLKQEAQ